MNASIHLMSQSFNVPCRRFSAALTVSKSERLPLVKEFALRLIYVHHSCSADHLNAFFGFSDREIGILVKDLVSASLVTYERGELSLTDETKSKFDTVEGGLPHISVVEPWIENFAIDFLSFSLLHWEIRPDSYRVFHNLESTDIEKVSQSKSVAKEVFANSFYEYVEKYKTSVSDEERANLSIYGISSVQPRDTFSFPLTVDIVIQPQHPGQALHEYPDFRTEAEQARRGGLIRSVSRKVDDLKASGKFEGNWSRVFVDELRDTFYAQLVSREGLLIRGLCQHTWDMESTLYDSGKSQAFIGDLSKDENKDLVLSHIDEAFVDSSDISNQVGPVIFWGKPTNDFWMRNSNAFDLAAEVASRVGHATKGRPELRLVLNNRYEDHFAVDKRLRRGNNTRLFSKGLGVNLTPDMASSEIVLIPGQVAVYLFYYLDSSLDSPIPFGFVTRHPQRLALIERWARRQWSGFGRKVYELWCSKRNSKKLEQIEISARQAFSDLRAMDAANPKRSSTLSLKKD